MINVLSYGGGVNSSALFFYIMENKMPLDLVIFADTGEELNETYDAVNRMNKICLEKGIKFVIAKSYLGNLYEHYYKKKAVMSMMKRDCTGKFKISPIRKYLRETYGKKAKFRMYIGICWDESLRVRVSNVRYIENSYPFVDNKITRLSNFEILKKYGFKAIKSGCKGCMYNKKVNWVKMLLENPEEFERHLKLEENGSGFPKVMLNGSYTLRSLKEANLNQQTLNQFIDNRATCEVYGSCFL